MSAFYPKNCLVVTKNTNTIINVTAKDDSGNAIDITGYIFYFTMKCKPNLSNSLASVLKVVTSHTNPTQGQTSFSILPTDTTNLQAGKYYYDIVSKDLSGNFTSWEDSHLFLKQSVFNSIEGDDFSEENNNTFTFCLELGTRV